MPIIIDANKMSDCVSKSPDAIPILKGLAENKIKMVYGGNKMLAEYKKNMQFLGIVVEFGRIGSAKKLSDAPIDLEQIRHMTSGLMTSDDPHILAVATSSGARLLFTADSALIVDFKNKSIIDSPRGKIYNLADSFRLLAELGS